jgi:RNA-directed DNA polymerase
MKIQTAFPLWNSNEDNQKKEWSAINWRTVKTFARRLENSIAKAVKHGDWDQVHKLRRIWNSSKLVKLLAVRGPTQDNKGKRTAGVDGIRVTMGEQRLAIANELRIDGETSPLRRVYIPKPNGKKRPLGIPTIKERCKMALAKGSIEPIYEQLAEPNSYGFRPARSIHDAIQAIFGSIKTKQKWALEGDLKGFFDNISLDAILNSPVITNLDKKTKTQIKAWAPSGVVHKGIFEPTDKGTPQGGVISPLLAKCDPFHAKYIKMCVT